MDNGHDTNIVNLIADWGAKRIKLAGDLYFAKYGPFGRGESDTPDAITVESADRYFEQMAA
jgi:hypothetical protein